MSTSQLRVAICGAGIGGLVLATVIGKFNPHLPIDLYEAGPEISTVGAGISLWKRTWEIAQAIGLDQVLFSKSMCSPFEGITLRRADQQEGYNFGLLPTPKGTITLHRTDFIGVLRNALPASCTVHLSHRLAKYEHDSTNTDNDDIILYFENGTTATCNVLVGADGIRSRVREKMYHDLATAHRDPKIEKHAYAAWSGTYGYRTLLPTERIRAKDPNHRALSCFLNYAGKGRHIICYPVSNGTLLNIVAFYTEPGGEGKNLEGERWVHDASPEEVIHQYEGWEPEVQTILKCIEKTSRWAICVVPSIPTYVSRHIAIIGDAAHAMTTHFGSGAGQAVEDAYLLGRILAYPSLDVKHLPEALKIYDRARRPLATKVQTEARLMGLMYEFDAPGLYDGLDKTKEVERAGLEELEATMKKKLEWQDFDRPGERWIKVDKELSDLLST